MHRHRTLHLLLLAGMIGGPAVVRGAVPAAADQRPEQVSLALPDAADLVADAEDAGLALATKPVRKHKYKGRRTSHARSRSKRKSGAKSRHGRKGGGVRKTGYASKKKASRKRKSFKSKPRTRKGSARGGRGR